MVTGHELVDDIIGEDSNPTVKQLMLDIRAKSTQHEIVVLNGFCKSKQNEI